MIYRWLALIFTLTMFATGCATIEGGYRYEYDGKLFRADGKTPAKGVSVRMTRPDAPEAPDLPEKLAKTSVKYIDRSQRAKTDQTGKYLGTLETVKGWKYEEFMGMHAGGPTKPPEPPPLDEVILYVQEKGSAWIGYRVKLAPESQQEAISGIRKVHVPDLLLPDAPTTRSSKGSRPTSATPPGQ